MRSREGGKPRPGLHADRAAGVGESRARSEQSVADCNTGSATGNFSADPRPRRLGADLQLSRVLCAVESTGEHWL